MNGPQVNRSSFEIGEVQAQSWMYTDVAEEAEECGSTELWVLGVCLIEGVAHR